MRNVETEYIGTSKTFHGAVPMIMGTRLEMLMVGCCEEDARMVWDWLCIEGFHLDSILDRFNPESELSRLNASPDAVSDSSSLVSIVRSASRYRELTDGYFDIALGDSDMIAIDKDDRICLGGAHLDFGGIAKGYLLRLLSDRMKPSGVESAFVDFGGSSIMTVGHHPFGDCWKVGVRNPFGPGILSEVELRDSSMSTSGNTPLYGSHIINPFSGEPVDERKVVNVVCPDPLDAEVLSTALMTAPEDMTEEIASRFSGASYRIFK